MPFQVVLEPSESGLREISKAQPEQIRSVSVGRLGARLGRLAPARMGELDEAISLHLGLD